MAHSCPRCGCTCYCGGDIDDSEFEGTPEQENCDCCLGCEDDDSGFDDDYPMDGEEVLDA